jgi:hypothetical protein
MFDQVFENARRAAEASIRMQHEMLRGWSGLWPGVPAPPRVRGRTGPHAPEGVVRIRR